MCPYGVHREEWPVNANLLAAPVSTKFIHSPSKSLHRRHCGDVLEVDMLRVSEEIIYVHAVVGIHLHGNARSLAGDCGEQQEGKEQSTRKMNS